VGETFTAAEIVLCEPAFNRSMMAENVAQPGKASARTALQAQAIEDMIE
jgi:hypothetical protein